MTEKEWMLSQLDGLKGAKVLLTQVEEVDEYLNIPIILFKKTDGSIVQLEIVGDAEGNQSAHIEVHNNR